MRLDFYDLKDKSPDEALLLLIEQIVQSKKRTVIVLKDEKEAERINGFLWTFDENSFIPHGNKNDGNERKQPIYLADAEEFKQFKENTAPNSASFIVYMNVAIPDIPDKNIYERCFIIFGNRDQAVLENARTLWKKTMEIGGEKHLWRRDGKWHEVHL